MSYEAIDLSVSGHAPQSVEGTMPPTGTDRQFWLVTKFRYDHPDIDGSDVQLKVFTKW